MDTRHSSPLSLGFEHKLYGQPVRKPSASTLVDHYRVTNKTNHMKKLSFLLVVAALFACTLTACTDHKVVVQYPDGQREYVRTTLYGVGDTVCVVSSFGGGYGSYTGISSAYWQDTTVVTTLGDSSRYYSSYRMGVIVNP